MRFLFIIKLFFKTSCTLHLCCFLDLLEDVKNYKNSTTNCHVNQECVLREAGSTKGCGVAKASKSKIDGLGRRFGAVEPTNSVVC